ncbi:MULTISPECIES: c-type cytochrome [unclassified Simplicispira]|jgi:cytochrome c|uniref:c-type cytochrome n=1 Tax=unclassified Simplicispira TaxID=2630407 RepID=UPI000D5C591C|nr:MULTISPECIES: c-type cytochrome [unclassified Simplicispira]MBH1977390.1 c-type cytochrome [Comamonadaceae bacterium]PVY55088.1 cytochrome c [Simplicispira sp. 125]REG16031.1 cytochrome c [Simplicispira sp. 110]
MKRTLITLAMTLAVAAPALADEALAKSKNCMACHAVDKKLVGPAYKEVAKKYAGQKDAEATLITHVMKGSKGVWGPVPMPANAQVNEAEAKKLVDWVLSLK